jgi:hypothetical protein
VEILKEAMTSTEGARKLLHIARKESSEEQGRELEERAFFGYARRHKGVAYLSHQTAKLVGGDFDGDTGQHIPIPRQYKPFEEIERPDRDFSNLYPIFQRMKEEGWGQVETTEKIKRRLATHWAPEDETELTEDNQLGLDGAVIEMSDHRQEFTAALIERVHHGLHENEAVQLYEEVRAGQRSRLPPGFWQGEEGQQNARTIFTHLIANVDKFKYDTGADMEYVNGLSRMVEPPAWLAEHKKPDVFVDRTVFSEHDDAQSVLWNYVSSRFEAYDPPPMPLEFYRDQVPDNFTPEQRLVVYRLKDDGERQWIGVVPRGNAGAFFCVQ